NTSYNGDMLVLETIQLKNWNELNEYLRPRDQEQVSQLYVTSIPRSYPAEIKEKRKNKLAYDQSIHEKIEGDLKTVNLTQGSENSTLLDSLKIILPKLSKTQSKIIDLQKKIDKN